MATILDKPLKRELVIDGQPYTLTITPEGVKITLKGRRLGREMLWRDLLSGDAELASQLLRSVSDVKAKRPVAAKESTAKPVKSGAQSAERKRRRKALPIPSR